MNHKTINKLTRKRFVTPAEGLRPCPFRLKLFLLVGEKLESTNFIKQKTKEIKLKVGARHFNKKLKGG